MSYYRIYLWHEGHIKKAQDFNFETDEQAFTHAKTLLGTYAVAEVWNGASMIGTARMGFGSDLCKQHEKH